VTEHEKHRDHTHVVSADADVRYVMLSLVFISAFLVIEVVAAILSSSLALLADAGHMLIDVAALATSAWALRLAKRPAKERWTYGLRRAEILSAAANGVTLVAVALLIGVEAVQRLFSPHHVTGGLVVVVAVLGIFINGFAA